MNKAGIKVLISHDERLCDCFDSACKNVTVCLVQCSQLAACYRMYLVSLLQSQQQLI